jgi:DNA modification methylase
MSAAHVTARSLPAGGASHRLPRGRIVVDLAEHVYPDLPDGCVDLVISDGPYGMRKAAWDRIPLDKLGDWYAPHVEAWSTLCRPSASLYLWNTPAGLAQVDRVVQAAGWTLRTVITWDKGANARQGRENSETARSWFETSEVCGFYQRDEVDEYAAVDLWNTYGAAHPVRLYLERARVAAGLSLQDVDAALGVRDMARHWFSWSQWTLPSAARYAALATLLGLTRSRDDLAAEAAAVHARWRAEVDARRAYFDGAIASGIGNVWSAPDLNPRTTGRGERLLGADGKSLHPCQKPLAFYERMIRASTPPPTPDGRSAFVLEPFGGTCRAAVWCEQAPADQRRRYLCVEPDLDGRGYVPAVLASLAG